MLPIRFCTRNTHNPLSNNRLQITSDEFQRVHSTMSTLSIPAFQVIDDPNSTEYPPHFLQNVAGEKRRVGRFLTHLQIGTRFARRLLGVCLVKNITHF